MIQEEQLLACENQLIDAIRNGNVAVLEELLHDKLLFIIPTGQTITKEIDLESYRSGLLTVYDIQTNDYVIQSFEDVSIVTVTVGLHAKYADQNINGTFRYLRVWKLINQSHKIIGGSGFQIQ